jgi:hypothetical protein
MAKKATPSTSTTGEEASSRAAGEAANVVELPAVDPESAAALVAEEASTAAAAPQARITKLSQIRTMLVSPSGASLATLCKATGWQSHSVRAALTGLRKAGNSIEKGKAGDGTTLYRITSGPEAAK